jgi:hypothetical protein
MLKVVYIFRRARKLFFWVLLQSMIQKTALKTHDAKCVNPRGTRVTRTYFEPKIVFVIREETPKK